ncbi:Tripartite tricarboxylate transporter TctB family protein [Devosia sp. LC5]|uniref:tripartite tricarboxylate transporter TctB family protein n=1 Tax=Devosia sp. LC5 TaxID=1502724 RepID=UPI0004E2C2D9|nr:tripartite tricarboxylate transporter TctB family protein [Devosia sp. LC5]KFC69491.1 Tripartite tricarboxylate transporter TctB family protein [Devosia sp. LC5]
MPDNSDATEEGVRARADLLTALVLVALGLAVVYLSWTMPRLEARHIHPATIPGLVPLFLGIGLTCCGGLLLWRSWRIKAPGGWQSLFGLLRTRETLRIGVVLGLALIHTLVLVGLIPFWAAAMLFIFAFIMIFETWLNEEPAEPLKSLCWALAIAVVGGGGIYLVFERIFLVRLP